MEPLLIVVWTAGVASAACWLLSLVTRDTSWVAVSYTHLTLPTTPYV